MDPSQSRRLRRADVRSLASVPGSDLADCFCENLSHLVSELHESVCFHAMIAI